MKKINDEADQIFAKIKNDYAINDSAGLLLLNCAKENFITIRKCQAIIEKDGLIVEDKWHVKKQHPALRVLNSARSQMLQAIRLLNLELSDSDAESRGPGRPGVFAGLNMY